MTMWEDLENHVLVPANQYAQAHGYAGANFTNHDVSTVMGCSDRQATRYIQEYLRAQRSAKSRTKFVLKRKDRTRNARWSIGQRTRDGHSLVAQTCTDFEVRIERALEKDLTRLGTINPHAVQPLLAQVQPHLQGLRATVSAIVSAAKGHGGSSA